MVIIVLLLNNDLSGGWWMLIDRLSICPLRSLALGLVPLKVLLRLLRDSWLYLSQLRMVALNYLRSQQEHLSGIYGASGVLSNSQNAECKHRVWCFLDLLFAANQRRVRKVIRCWWVLVRSEERPGARSPLHLYLYLFLYLYLYLWFRARREKRPGARMADQMPFGPTAPIWHVIRITIYFLTTILWTRPFPC